MFRRASALACSEKKPALSRSPPKSAHASQIPKSPRSMVTVRADRIRGLECAVIGIGDWRVDFFGLVRGFENSQDTDLNPRLLFITLLGLKKLYVAAFVVKVLRETIVIPNQIGRASC